VLPLGSYCEHDKRYSERRHGQKQCVVGPSGNCGKHVNLLIFRRIGPVRRAQPIWGRNLAYPDETSLRQVTNSSFDTVKTAGFLETQRLDQTFI
jgi:hypothetical protein